MAVDQVCVVQNGGMSCVNQDILFLGTGKTEWSFNQQLRSTCVQIMGVVLHAYSDTVWFSCRYWENIESCFCGIDC